MQLPRSFLLLLTLHLVDFVTRVRAEPVMEVDSSVRSSIEEFLKSRSKLRMDHQKPLKVAASQNNNGNLLFPHEKTTKQQDHHRASVELAREALQLIYHELYGDLLATNTGVLRSTEYYANATEDAPSRSRSLSPRQSFFSNGLHSISEYMMSLMENSLEDLPSLPRLEAQECIKRSVCEAHNQPKKYGLIGLVLQLLFPPYTKTEDPGNAISKYQLAARYGRQVNANCGIQYDGCMLNLLDIVQALVNAFIR